jgi:hypothetical protein
MMASIVWGKTVTELMETSPIQRVLFLTLLLQTHNILIAQKTFPTR